MSQSIPLASLEIRDAVFRELIRISPALNYRQELAVYGFHNDNGGLPAALKMFTALLAANYHPSLTSTTCVNGIYSLTLVELPSRGDAHS